MTNADKIRQMSDEELAYIFNRTSSCASWVGNARCITPQDCMRCWVNWLKQEVTE